MVEFLTDFIVRHGYLAVALLMAAENLFPPLPSELIMPFAGFVAARGELDPAGVIASGTLGSLLGALPWFYAGRALGHERLAQLAARRSRWLTVTPAGLEQAQLRFRRHGALALVVGRLLPGVRTLIAVPAGVAGLGLGRYLFWSLLGALLWCFLLTAAGYGLERQYERIAGWLEPASRTVFGVLLALYLLRVARGSGLERPR
jgi:membrane protein DedA with SNARE-associated domain